MHEITEDRLVFRFPDDWHVVKYDDPRSFASRRFKIDGTKKVDILALSPDHRLHVIEIKDFRQHAIKNKDRLKLDGDDPLHVEVAKKVRDTMAVLVAAYRDGDEDLKPVCAHLFRARNRDVDVILFLEEDEPRARTARGFRDRSIVELGIKAQLKPYGFRCRVLRRRTMEPGTLWSVTALPAGSAGTTGA